MSKVPMDLLRTRGSAGAGPPPTHRAARKRSADALGVVPLFSGLSRRHLNQLADVAQDIQFHQGATVIREGDGGETMFCIVEGEATVSRGGKRLAALRPGDFFGEISLLDRGPRTATVTASTPLSTIMLARKPFLGVVESEPALANRILVEVAKRLRRTERAVRG